MSGNYSIVFGKLTQLHPGINFYITVSRDGLFPKEPGNLYIGQVPFYEDPDDPRYDTHDKTTFNAILHLYKVAGTYLPIDIKKSAERICDVKPKDVSVFIPQLSFPFEMSLLETLYGIDNGREIHRKLLYAVDILRVQIGKLRDDFFTSLMVQAKDGKKSAHMIPNDIIDVHLDSTLKDILETDMPKVIYIDGNKNIEKVIVPKGKILEPTLVLIEPMYFLVNRLRINEILVEEWWSPSGRELEHAHHLLEKKCHVRLDQSHPHMLRYYPNAPYDKIFEPLEIGPFATSWEDKEKLVPSDILHLVATDGDEIVRYPHFLWKEAKNSNSQRKN